MGRSNNLDLLHDAVRSGRWLEASAISGHFEIAAGILRDMLLHHPSGPLPPSRAINAGQKDQLAITHAGIHIVGMSTPGDDECPVISIVPDVGSDIIDLSDLASADANPLPALSFIGCRITAPLVLRGSHFARITLDHCRIEKIDADHIQIDNNFSLKHLRSCRDGADAPAQVRLVGARIAGHLDLRGSHLSAPLLARRNGRISGSIADRYALSLSSARVGGRVIFDGGFTARGSASLYQALIAGSLIIGRAQFESVDTELPALDAEEIRIDGALIWRPSRRKGESRPLSWHVAGCVTLKRAKIGGDAVFAGCRWAREGALSLRDDGTLLDHIQGGIDMRLANIGGQLEIIDNCEIMRRGVTPYRKQEDNVDRRLFGPAIDAWKLNVANGIRIAESCRFFGPLYFGNSVIGNGFAFAGSIDFDLTGATIDRYPEALEMTDANVRGLVRLDGRVSGVVTLRRSRIDGGLYLRDLTIKAGVLTLGDRVRDRDAGYATLLDFGELIVSGGVHIATIRIIWDATRQKWLSELPKAAIGAALIGKKYHGSNRTTFYLRNGGQFDAFRNKGKLKVLDGSLSSFLQMVGRPTGPIGQQNAQDYIAQFCEHTRGSLGAVEILRYGSPEKIGELWHFPDAIICYGNQCYRSSFEVGIDGLRVGASTLIPERNPAPRLSHYVGPIRLGGPPALPGDMKDVGIGERQEIDGAFDDYMSGREFRPSYIDFRGLKCRSFDDLAGGAWNTSKDALGPQFQWRLLLDGIDFDILGTSEPGNEPAVAERALELNRRTAMLLSFCDIEAHDKRFMAHVARSFEERSSSSPTGEQSKILQRPNKELIRRSAQHPTYSPQPLETFAHAYFVNGDRRASNRLLKISQEIEWERRARSRAISRADQGWLRRPWRYYRSAEAAVVHLIGNFYGARFGYGLSPRRALVTFLTGLLVSVAASWVSSENGALRPLTGDDAKNAITEGCKVSNDGLADIVLYTLDTYLPLIDLRKECAFALERTHSGFAFFSILDSAIAIVGGVISSLTLITLTGLVRRFPRA